MRTRSFVRLGSIIGLTSLGLATLTVACNSDRPKEPEPVARMAQRLEGQHTLTLRVPAGLPAFAPVLVATQRLGIGAHAQIDPGNEGGAPVVSLGEALLRVEPDAKVHDLWSRGPVDLRDRVRVAGTVYAAQVTLGNDVVTEGSQNHTPALDPPTELIWQVTYPEVGAPGVHLEPDQTAAAAPGRYAQMRVGPRATLKLASGTYYLDQALELETDSTLELDQSQGPVLIYTSTAKLRGSIVTTNGESPNLLLAALGTETVFVERAYDGALLAPSAGIVLRNVPEGHRGYFAAKEVDVDAGATVRYRLPPAVLVAADIDPAECFPLDQIAGLEGPLDEPVLIESTSCLPACNPRATCSGHGTCVSVPTGTRCECAPGFTGADCEVPELLIPTSNGPAPPLTGPESPEVRVDRFLDWMMLATVSDLQSAVQRIFPVHGDETLGAVLVNRFNAERNQDSARSLVILSVLGEMRTNAGYGLFTSVLDEPLPPSSEGHDENPERLRLLGYQLKAVHGIGYLFNPVADGKLLELADQHPSLSVRAQAVRTYAFNQGEAGREIARSAARPDERWLADRFENRDLDSGKTFDERLAEFNAQHPELAQQIQP